MLWSGKLRGGFGHFWHLRAEMTPDHSSPGSAVRRAYNSILWSKNKPLLGADCLQELPKTPKGPIKAHAGVPEQYFQLVVLSRRKEGNGERKEGKIEGRDRKERETEE